MNPIQLWKSDVYDIVKYVCIEGEIGVMKRKWRAKRGVRLIIERCTDPFPPSAGQAIPRDDKAEALFVLNT